MLAGVSTAFCVSQEELPCLTWATAGDVGTDQGLSLSVGTALVVELDSDVQSP